MRLRFPLPALLGGSLSWLALLRYRRSRARARQWQQRQASGPGTAFITGASSGIGAAFARALAPRGYRLVLLARRADRLEALAEALRAGGAPEVTVLVADLSQPDDVTRAAQALAALPDLTLLINNAGYGLGGRFSHADIQAELRMIQVHVSASVHLTRAALPGMIARGHGGIIQVSSIAALLPMPGNATYGATKAYLNFFTGSLNAELGGSGVRVQALCPGFTYSEFHDVSGMGRNFLPARLWMRAEDVVSESLRGLETGQELVIPGRFYRALAWLMRLPPAAPLARQVQRARLARQKRPGY